MHVCRGLSCSVSMALEVCCSGCRLSPTRNRHTDFTSGSTWHLPKVLSGSSDSLQFLSHGLSPTREADPRELIDPNKSQY